MNAPRRVTLSFTTLLCSMACGRTEPFGTETYHPGFVSPDEVDGGAPEDAGPTDHGGPGEPDAGDAGPAPDARPNFPDLGFPDLGCDGCDDIREILDAIRWESPCLAEEGPTECRSPGTRRAVHNLRGLPGAQYEAVLRFRGVVEHRTYLGGYHEGRAWQIGGGPTANARNIFQLEFTSPAQTIFLNRTDEQVDFCERVDERLAFRFNVGTSIVTTVQSRGVQRRNLGRNGQPIIVGGVPPAPDAYDGQFIQMSVDSIKRIR